MANLTTVVYASGSLAATITGTVSTVDAILASGMPIAQGGNTAIVKAASTPIAAGDAALAVGVSPNTPVKVYDGSNTVTVKAASTTVALTDTALVVGVSPNTPTKVFDGSNTVAVKAASTAAVATDPALVVANSPNNPVKVYDGTNTVVVKAASTAAVATDAALVVALSPNNVNANGQTSMAASAPVVIASNQTFSSGAAFPTGGDVAPSVANSGNPIFIGGLGKTTNPGAVSDGQRVGATFDKLGKQVVVGSIRDLKGSAYASLATGTETTIVAGIASTFLDVYGCIVANNSATATQIAFKDSLTGTTRFNFYVPAGDTRGFMLPESGGFAQATVNQAWTALCLPSVAAVLITLMYVKNT
jgi:hypothetical protein